MQRNFTQELTFRTSKSSGSGGQNVNKVSTKVELLFHVDSSKLLSVKEKSILKRKLNNRIAVNGHLYLVCQETRSQLKNKQLVIERFYELIYKSLIEQKKRIPIGIPESLKQKRLADKRMNSEKKKLRSKVRYRA